MAGRKQHFIPKHYLKQFVVPNGADKLWMYRKGLPEPVQVSRIDVAATRDFYSKPSAEGYETLDDLITQYENDLAAIVDEIRNVPVGETIPSKEISEVVAHLVVRTAHMREFIEEGISLVVSSVEAMPNEILDRENFPKHKVPSKFMDIALEEFEKSPLKQLTPITSETLVRMAYQRLREDFEQFHESALAISSLLLEEIQGRVSGLGGETHKRVLTKELVPEVRRQALERFHWKVVELPSNDAVLPDCVAIAKDDEGWGPCALTDRMTTTHVVVPLSSGKLAVGSSSHDWEDVIECYNRVAQESSLTFYLTGRRQDRSQLLLEELGSSTRSKLSNITSTAYSNAVASFRFQNENSESQLVEPVTWADAFVGEGFNFSVSLRDFGDDEHAKMIAEEIAAIVKELAAILPLHRIDGFTFANDFEDALKALDPDKDINSLIGIDPNSSTVQILVRRNNKLKTHFVLRGYLAGYLAGRDTELKDEAENTICYGLGTLAFYTLVETKFSEQSRVRDLDDFECWLLRYNESLLATYFSYRLVNTRPKEQEFYAELALDELNSMVQVTSKAHDLYQLDRDHESYFETSAVCASRFMTSLARYFASCKNENTDLHSENLLWNALCKFGLSKWAKLFSEDLFSFNSGLNDWVDFDEVNFLNRHLERLLFDFGIVADQLQDGTFYVHVSDQHKLSYFV
ncbi:DUF4238 domain-containing protein [Thalassospira indica]|uniref:DUF4238 domain-containing protein n=1 Tax=Thalassospira indica TaxID=1891279 RepID=A0ABN5NGM4_9PROT|nr:DUF4238 domain-containing protein [Thalassospira indica]AXO14563.1 DUF4238 domain-containing protein [Thalassospira indica]OAZ09996.1 hypothetical protein TH15_19465 [Thalassospira profundimaris]